jgi:hypothetical protein
MECIYIYIVGGTYFLTQCFWDMTHVVVSVTLPEGVAEGQTIHVQAPDGKINAIVVPPGFGPGSTFTVEFTTDETAPPAPPSTKETYHPSSAPVIAPAAPSYPASATHDADDGFASGFNNPHYRQPTTTSAPATTNFSDDYYSQYPTAQATSVGYK